jgi:hypothetical protein
VRADLPDPRAALEALIGPLVEFVLDEHSAGTAGDKIDPSQLDPRPGARHREASAPA